MLAEVISSPLPALMRSHSMSTNSSKFLQKYDLRTFEFNMQLNGWQRLHRQGALLLPHVPQSVSGHLDQDIRAPA